MILDPRTIAVTIVVSAFLMGTGMWAVTRGYLGQIRGVSRWATATLVQAVGWALVGPLRDVLPMPVWTVAGYFFLAFSLAQYVLILAEFSGRVARESWVYGVVLAQSAALAWVAATSQGPGVRTLVVNVSVALLMLTSSHLLLSGPEERPASHAFTGFLFLTCGLMMAARGAYELFLLTDPSRATRPLEGAVNNVTYVIFYVTATLLPFAFLLMVSDRYIAQRRTAEAGLQQSLQEKEALLREAHHRVKNNLQLITSLMRLEAGRRREPETQAVLKEMQSRLRSVVLLNETLYRTGSYARVRLGDYLRQVSSHLFGAQNPHPQVRLIQDLADVEVETRQAIPCGLLVNELVTNSLKHAFVAGSAGEVTVSLEREPDGRVTLRVSDNGGGLPSDFEAKRGHSLGLQLVTDLTRQLQGSLAIGPGSTFTIVFVPSFVSPGADAAPQVSASGT